MKPEQIRDLDSAELERQLKEITGQLFHLRFQMRMGQMDGLKKVRQMRKDRKSFEVVILDPPKLVEGRDELEQDEGITRYEDLNSLGIVVTEPGGLLVTCSCSGPLPPPVSFWSSPRRMPALAKTRAPCRSARW